MERVEYFWETEYRFVEFLSKIFKEQYQRKYSLTGGGIYNIVTIDNKIYEITYKNARKINDNDNAPIRDKNKEYILNSIASNLKEGTTYSIFSGKYISFKVGQFIAKCEIIQKRVMPQ